ncbi:MAG: CRISPR-associated endonuclease Cas1 [Brooklawnia sp.]|jgi:CRISPR-associated protein Cas1
MTSLAQPADSIPISLVAHTVFCPRRAWLEASGEVVESAAIDFGTRAHRRVDKTSRRDAFTTSSLHVYHSGLGLTGRCDVVESNDNGALDLIEYKSTPVRRKAEVTQAQRIQLALQALCLRSMGHRIRTASIYFTNHNQRVQVELVDSLLEEARGWVQQTRSVVTAADAPPPLREDDRCRWCSHATICLPDEFTNSMPARSISVSDPAGEMVHLMTPGSRAYLKSGRLEVVKGDEALASLPMERVASVTLHGNIDISSALLRELLWHRRPVVWCSSRGRVVGWANSADSPNGAVRVRQHSLAEQGSLPLAREFVYAKVANQASFLRRNGNAPEIVTNIRRTQSLIREARSLPELFALEGRAARLYFSAWHLLLKGPNAEWFLSAWPGRQGRLASDALNVSLNLCYSLLLADAIRSCVACGLDPHAGFLHSPSRNKPALALDLGEEFRAPIADSTVITAINSGALKPTDFSSALGDHRIHPRGRAALVKAYETRITTRFKHPLFGYSVTWRRAIEVQARLVLGYLDGTQTVYQGITIR